MGASVWSYLVPYDPDIAGVLQRLRWEVFERREYVETCDEDDVPTSPDQVLDLQPHSGSHSIIDMMGVADSPARFRVAPYTDAQLQQIFGSSRPSREQLEAWQDTPAATEPTWVGRYVVTYTAGRPDGIAFFGASGD